MPTVPPIPGAPGIDGLMGPAVQHEHVLQLGLLHQLLFWLQDAPKKKTPHHHSQDARDLASARRARPWAGVGAASMASNTTMMVMATGNFPAGSICGRRACKH